LTYNEQRELATIEEKILTAEEGVKELQEQLNQPALYKERAAEVPALVAALESARAQVELLYARWQELDALPKK
ncbi:MAG TPA: ABC transporter ATP-binding protein, partial [Pseudomonadota bacterium]|nr:ABC transporter ATP-binding protein [Pseudomonadota bacterium]